MHQKLIHNGVVVFRQQYYFLTRAFQKGSVICYSLRREFSFYSHSRIHISLPGNKWFMPKRLEMPLVVHIELVWREIQMSFKSSEKEPYDILLFFYPKGFHNRYRVVQKILIFCKNHFGHRILVRTRSFRLRFWFQSNPIISDGIYRWNNIDTVLWVTDTESILILFRREC